MDARHKSSPPGEDFHENPVNVDFERMANPLTVVHGYIQILQRRVRRGQAIDGDDLLRILDLMEVASRSVSSSLAALADKSRSGGVRTRSE